MSNTSNTCYQQMDMSTGDLMKKCSEYFSGPEFNLIYESGPNGRYCAVRRIVSATGAGVSLETLGYVFAYSTATVQFSGSDIVSQRTETLFRAIHVSDDMTTSSYGSTVGKAWTRMSAKAAAMFRLP